MIFDDGLKKFGLLLGAERYSLAKHIAGVAELPKVERRAFFYTWIKRITQRL